MQERVDGIAAVCVAEGIHLDIPGLVREQADRRTWLSRSLTRRANTDWDAVRAGASLTFEVIPIGLSLVGTRWGSVSP